MSLIDAVMGELNQGHVDTIARQLGVSPDQAQGAIDQALPLLVGAMAKTHGTPQGAQALHGVLDGHAGLDVGGILDSVIGGGRAQQGGGLGDVLGSVLGGGNARGGGGLGDVLGSVLGGGSGGAMGGGDLGGLGSQVLGQIFGGRQNQANQGLGQTTGLGTQNAAQLLALLAPIVMAVMARMRQQQGHDNVGSILGGDVQRSQQSGGVVGGLMGAVLDRDGDGDVDLSDLMAAGGGLLGSMRR